MKRIALFASVLALFSDQRSHRIFLWTRKSSKRFRHGLPPSKAGSGISSPLARKKQKALRRLKLKPRSQSSRARAPRSAGRSPLPGRPYTIQEGDTVSEIARKHGIPRTAFMEANNIREGEQIYIGDQVIIPSPPQSGSRNSAGHTVGPEKRWHQYGQSIHLHDQIRRHPFEHRSKAQRFRGCHQSGKQDEHRPDRRRSETRHPWERIVLERGREQYQRSTPPKPDAGKRHERR